MILILVVLVLFHFYLRICAIVALFYSREQCTIFELYFIEIQSYLMEHLIFSVYCMAVAFLTICFYFIYHEVALRL